MLREIFPDNTESSLIHCVLQNYSYFLGMKNHTKKLHFQLNEINGFLEKRKSNATNSNQTKAKKKKKKSQVLKKLIMKEVS